MAKCTNKCKVCRILNICRSTLYNKLKSHKVKTTNYPYEKDIVRAFKNNLSCYGRRRLQKYLLKRNKKVSTYIITKVMKKYDLIAKHGRKRKANNIYTSPLFETKNLLKTAKKTDKIYSADMSVFNYKNGKIIVSGIIDIKTKILVGYTYSTNYKSDFVKQSFEDAFNKFGVPDIVHTDNGSQYKGYDVHNYIINNGARHSFSKPSNPHHNQYIESFWKTMKIEIGNTRHMSLEDMKKVIDYYIHYYNYVRLHSAIGYIPPIRLRNRL